MKKSTLIGTVIVLGSVAFFTATRLEQAEAPSGVASLSLPATGYTEHAQYYDIAANYATSTPLIGNVNAAAVALMESFVSDTITQFKQDGNFAKLTPNDIHMMGFDQGKRETLQITYLIASSAHTVSYIFTIYEDTLGAHGNTFFHTFTFDTSTGAALSLGDMFVPRSEYLATLSSIARAKLPSSIGDSADTKMIAGGTTPEDRNFANFFFDNKDFVILFAPYAVASYVAGPQTLRIPISDLVNILKPEYR